jgi:hypothetical protein
MIGDSEKKKHCRPQFFRAPGGEFFDRPRCGEGRDTGVKIFFSA